MSVHKRKTSTGHTWAYHFDGPESTPELRKRVSKSGFATKKKAQDAESIRRAEVLAEFEAKKRGRDTIPQTLRQLLVEFYADCDTRLAAKTVSRYREHCDYLSPHLLEMELRDITTLHLHHEWKRLVKEGGRGRRAGKPLSAKTVRNMAGTVSSAFSRAIFWGLVDRNPTEKSEPPRVKKAQVVIPTPEQATMLLNSSMHPAIPMLLDIADGTGARRGEVMAARWSDIKDGRIAFARSLSQVDDKVFFKTTKKERVRIVSLPESLIPTLHEHRRKQDELRAQFGPDYQTELDLIICAPDGSPLKPNSISASVSALCKRLKLPKGVSLHAIRHAHASQLLADGMEITAVAARLGHASVSTTLEVYGHVIRGRDDEAAKLIDKSRKARVASEVTQ